MHEQALHGHCAATGGQREEEPAADGTEDFGCPQLTQPSSGSTVDAQIVERSAQRITAVRAVRLNMGSADPIQYWWVNSRQRHLQFDAAQPTMQPGDRTEVRANFSKLVEHGLGRIRSSLRNTH